ncbi:MalY/PatB family protein [Rahnella sikkimica]|uniref:cysteine-S-conjugate beta-lyase n=1 Tax=Rahnella sikkimica TaxID=1805933 RepID=A0A2L1UN81_9GAMM|nr:MalY/PatB family protein [Rahnella sikkimica]AVF34389.1 cystathionine beta-lyase [Rahnella sikkimica]
MRPDFDAITDRRSQHSTKWSAVKNLTTDSGKPVIPLWIADMEFRSPPEVIGALHRVLEQGILGYTDYPAEFTDAFCRWQSSRHRWEISREWVVPCQSVITALDVAIRCLSEPGDEILVLSPGFGTFRRVIQHTGRRVVQVPLTQEERFYSLDLSRLAKTLTTRTRMLILCNPHNPIGKVWRADELRKIGGFCQQHNLLLLSDDVHQDLILGDTPYTPLAGISGEFADFTLTFTSPGKTFNLAGLQAANVIIKNDDIRKKVRENLYQLSAHKPNMLALHATDAAYRHGEAWLDALLDYLKGNLAYLDTELKTFAHVDLFRVQGSFLAWLDFRKTGLSQPELEHKLLHQAGLLADSGVNFGHGGEGFMRVNFAMPRSELEVVVRRLRVGFE